MKAAPRPPAAALTCSSATNPEPDVADAAPVAVAAAGDEAAEAYDKAVEGAYNSSDVAVEEAEEMRQIAGESSNGAAPAAVVAALPPPETAAPPPADPPPPVETADKSSSGSSNGCLIGIGASVAGGAAGRGPGVGGALLRPTPA